MSDCQRPNRPESLPPEHIPRVEELQTVSVLFKQLSDASRLRIFWLLCHCEACGTELAGIVEMTPPAVAPCVCYAPATCWSAAGRGKRYTTGRRTPPRPRRSTT